MNGGKGDRKQKKDWEIISFENHENQNQNEDEDESMIDVILFEGWMLGLIK